MPFDQKEFDEQVEAENRLKNRCGYCGLEVMDEQQCPLCRTVSKREHLIGRWDDCAWDI